MYRDPRPTWDEYFLSIAKAVAERGDCRRSQVGAVIWDMETHQVVSTGYNGVDPGKDGCMKGACPRGMLSYYECPELGSYSNCIARHAEENAIRWMYNTNPNVGSNKGRVISITRAPCDDCLDMIQGYGFHDAIWPGGFVIF